ncbi:hypothetical protein NDU88_006226 [Pleurodeles waltl]|uniref:Uncharacterized protein n=1 Tax=Pleurodeles waltl TaxID=8319 RepID=A0AAV7TDK1_PLEWA|nr:hypothetical protein NDU88_006226 [Pleurodeles waltl]
MAEAPRSHRRDRRFSATLAPAVVIRCPGNYESPSHQPFHGGRNRHGKDGRKGSRGAPGGPTHIFTVCTADSKKRDGCNCTRRTAATPPAPMLLPTSALGRWAETLFLPTGPVGML